MNDICYVGLFGSFVLFGCLRVLSGCLLIDVGLLCGWIYTGKVVHCCFSHISMSLQFRIDFRRIFS